MRRLTLSLLVLAGGCRPGGSSDALAVTDSAGVRVAQSDYDRPAWRIGDVWTLSATPRIQVGNRIGNPNQQLYQVRHAHRLPDGRIIVANTGLGDVRIFDDQGGHVTTLSMPTVGDDEPVNPVQVYPLPGDSLLAVGADESLTVFGPHGQIARRAFLSVPEVGVTETFQPVGMFGDGKLLFRVDLPDDPDASGTGRRRIRLLQYAPDGSPIGVYGDFEGQALLFADRGAWIFGPSATHTIADSTIWYGTTERFELHEIAPGERTLQVFRLDRPATAVISTDRTTYSQAARGEVRGTDLEERMDTTLRQSVFADTFPAYDRILVDDVGNLWVRNYQWFDMGSGYAWSVFDPVGRFLGEVRVPSLLEIYQIGPDFVLGRMATITGREAVYEYGLLKPGEEGSS